MASLVWVLPLRAEATHLFLNPVGSASSLGHNVGQGMTTDEAENLDGTGNDAFNQMKLSDRESHRNR